MYFFICRLPFIRSADTKSSDEDKLLVAMLEGERAITNAAWYNGFKNVNLNPDDAQPIEVWLSNISDHLEAAGDTHRFMHHGYNPTVEEVAFEANLKHLRSIKVPEKFQALSFEGKQKVNADTLHSLPPHYTHTATMHMIFNFVGDGTV